MLWFAEAIRTLIINVLVLFGAQLGKKSVFAVAAVAAFLAMTVAFVLVAKAAIAGMTVALPAWAQDYAGTFMPGNLGSCLGIVLSVKTARWIFDFKTRALAIAASSSSN